MIYRINHDAESEITPLAGQIYDDSWIAYCLTDSDNYQVVVGKNNPGVYTVKVSKNYTGWEMSVCDFLQFQESRHKNILLSIEQEDLERAQKLYKGHQYNDPFLREKEPDVLIHSTTYFTS